VLKEWIFERESEAGVLDVYRLPETFPNSLIDCCLWKASRMVISTVSDLSDDELSAFTSRLGPESRSEKSNIVILRSIFVPQSVVTLSFNNAETTRKFQNTLKIPCPRWLLRVKP
jgi:hypothetical protein